MQSEDRKRKKHSLNPGSVSDEYSVRVSTMTSDPDPDLSEQTDVTLCFSSGATERRRRSHKDEE